MQRLRDEAIRGFTLLEVLAAVAILGVSLVAVIALHVRTIRAQQIADRTTTATLLASETLQQTIAEIKEQGSPSLSYDEGDYGEGYEAYHWEYTLSTTPAQDLYRIDLTTYWDADHKETSSVTLTSFVYAP